ncbi:DUF1493 family protein [Trinickia mobilis]|uniref:DUF1493 family protein n=1 Tax=Trinickia mobilis TaxID=2816356 RepID=UPI001A8E0DE7|nr:DUF1493 family protein [Trinickia mobilis]
MAERDDEWTALSRFFEPRVGSRRAFGPNVLSRDMDLYHDLDMQPKAIGTALNDWAEQFGIDMSEFNLDFYYPTYKLTRWQFLITVGKSLYSKKAREVLGGRLLTLGMLEEAMIKRKWSI